MPLVTNSCGEPDMEPVATQRTVDQVQEDDSPRFPT